MDDDVLLISGGCSLLARQCFFLSWNFAKFQPEKIWFRPIQRIFHETKKFTQIHHISILLLLFFKSSDCCDEFQSVAKNIERFYFFFFLLSFLVCNLIWLNCFLDDRHFGYITKIPFPPPGLNQLCKPLKCRWWDSFVPSSYTLGKTVLLLEVSRTRTIE
jgi:hypothetical protein